MAGSATCGANGAGNKCCPSINIMRGISNDGGLAGRTARGVQPCDLLERDSKQAERVVLPQVLLGRERESGKILKLIQLRGMKVHCIAAMPEIRDVGIGVRQRQFESVQLQRAQLIAARGLDRLEFLRPRRLDDPVLPRAGKPSGRLWLHSETSVLFSLQDSSPRNPVAPRPIFRHTGEV